MPATKIGGNTTNILSCYFWEQIWHIKLNVYIRKSKLTSRKHCLLALLFSRNAKETHTDQIILQVLYSVWKETSYKPSKVVATKNFFPSVYVVSTACFEKGFLFLVITERHDFLYKFIVNQRFLQLRCCCFLKTVVWKSSCFMPAIPTIILQCSSNKGPN